MKKRFYLFDNYIKGFCNLVIICLVPIIAPLIYFNKYENGLLAHIMILIAICGILYEFLSIGIGEELIALLKIEKIIIVAAASIFIIYDISMIFIHGEFNGKNTWLDYCLVGYFIFPSIITCIEIFRIVNNYIKGNNENDNNKIAKGIVKNV